RLVDPVERVALPVELALRRVQVLRLRVRAQRPRAEPEHPPALIPDREGDPRSKPVVVTPPPPLLDQPPAQQPTHLLPRPLAPQQHLIPGARGHPHPEPPQHVLPQPPALQISPRPLRLRRLPQISLVELCRPLEQLPQLRPPPPSLLGPRVLVLALELDP